LVLFIRQLFNFVNSPEIRSQEFISSLKCAVDSLETIALRFAASSGTGVAILNSCELQDFFGGGLSDDSGTSGAGDQSDSDGASFAGHFAGHCVRFPDFVSPVAFAHRNYVQFGIGQSAFYCSLNFFVAFLAQAHVRFTVTDYHVGFETGALTGTGHFLHRFKLHNLENKKNIKRKYVFENLITSSLSLSLRKKSTI
jgi:hypothetical protein